MLTIIHAADFHLDSPFHALPPQEAVRRRSEGRVLLEDLAELVSRKGAQLVLLAGDLFDGLQVYPETIEALCRTLGGMDAQVCIAPGNHDYYSPRSPYATYPWPKNVHIFKQSDMSALPLPQLGCTVYGAAFTAPSREDDPLVGFTPKADGTMPIMVLHGEVEGKGTYGPLDPYHMAQSRLAYLALGHIHQTSGLQWAGNVPWAYPGCMEGRGYDETGEKGVLCVQVDDGSAQVEFCPLARHRYHICSVDVTHRTPAEALLEDLPQSATSDCYRVILKGESQVEGIDLAPLRALVGDRFYALELRDKTVVSQDLWQRVGEDTLTGLFLQEMQGRMTQDGDRELLDMALRFGMMALENREVYPR